MTKKVMMSTVIMICLCVPAYAGWVQVDKDGSTTLLSGGKIKEQSEGESLYSVLDTNKGTITFIDTERRLYGKDSIDKFCKMITATLEQMRTMNKTAPQTKGSPKVTVQKAGDGGIIAGYKTVKYKIVADGKLHQELWLAKDAALAKELGKLYIDTMNKVGGCMPSLAAMGDSSSAIESSPEYKKVEDAGWELKSITYSGGVNSVSEVMKLERKDIPASEFAVPSGFKKVSISDILYQE